MPVYSCWVFSKDTRCIFHREYDHQSATISTTNNNSINAELYPGQVNTLNESNESKLLYGLIHSLRSVSSQLALENNNNNNNKDDDDDNNNDNDENKIFEFNNSIQLSSNNRVYTLMTLQYGIHVRESLSGVKFVLLTDCATLEGDAQKALWRIHNDVWVEWVTQNGQWVMQNNLDKSTTTSSLSLVRNRKIVMAIDQILLGSGL
jgi:hypothetical protein